MWWVWQHGEFVWDQDDEVWDGDAPAEDWNAISPDLAYLRDTICEAMPKLRDPQQ